MIFFAQLLFFVSIMAFFFGIEKWSWRLLLLSTITFLPIAYYFLHDVVNVWQYLGLIPILLLTLTVIFWILKRTVSM